MKQVMPINLSEQVEGPTNRGELSSRGGKRLSGEFAVGTSEAPLITVITAVLKGRDCIESCLNSVLKQSYPNVEHIVFDGGSRDGTVEILRSYGDRIALWNSERDAGIYDAWNKVLAEARGEWICFLGADDELMPGALEQYMNLAARHPDAEYLSSQIRVVHPSGYTKLLGLPWSWPRYGRVMCAQHPGSMHRRRLFERLGNFDTSYGIVGDYELLLRARSGLKTAYMPVITVMMRAGGMGSSFKSLRETARAKVSTGGLNKTLAAFDFLVQVVLGPLRPPVRWILRTLGRSS